MNLNETIQELDSILKKLEEIRNERGEPIRTELLRGIWRIKEARNSLNCISLSLSRQKR